MNNKIKVRTLCTGIKTSGKDKGAISRYLSVTFAKGPFTQAI